MTTDHTAMCESDLEHMVRRLHADGQRGEVYAYDTTHDGPAYFFNLDGQFVASATGVGNKTVHRDLAAVSNDTPESEPVPVTGTD